MNDQVRFQVESRSSTAIDSVHCEGRITRLALDTVVVRPAGNCGIDAISPRVVQLELERQRGSQRDHAWKGFWIGAIAGGLAARLIVGDGCRIEGCDAGGFAQALFTGIGIVSGGFVGSVIAYRLPAGTEWRPIDPGPIRIDYSR